jgi:hypothetical protein
VAEFAVERDKYRTAHVVDANPQSIVQKKVLHWLILLYGASKTHTVVDLYSNSGCLTRY